MRLRRLFSTLNKQQKCVEHINYKQAEYISKHLKNTYALASQVFTKSDFYFIVSGIISISTFFIRETVDKKAIETEVQFNKRFDKLDQQIEILMNRKNWFGC